MSAEGRERRASILAAIADLPAHYRDAVTLRYVNELSFAEIAAATGRPEATIRTHLHRGLRRLRERLSHGDTTMTRQPSAADFALPETFIEDVMRRVDAAPRPMPVRSFWSAVLDRSAFDIVGSVAVAWRLLVGRRPRSRSWCAPRRFALVLLVAVSIGGTGTLAAAAAYRTVAPIVFRDDPRDLLSESTPTDAPDVVPRASLPIVVAVPDRPDGRAIARNGARSTSAAVPQQPKRRRTALPARTGPREPRTKTTAATRMRRTTAAGPTSGGDEDASDGEHDGSDEDAPDGDDDGGDHDASDDEADDGRRARRRLTRRRSPDGTIDHPDRHRRYRVAGATAGTHAPSNEVHRPTYRRAGRQRW